MENPFELTTLKTDGIGIRRIVMNKNTPIRDFLACQVTQVDCKENFNLKNNKDDIIISLKETNTKVGNFQEQHLKGAQYLFDIIMSFHDENKIKKEELMLTLTYLKLPNVGTRSSLQEILKQLRSANLEGLTDQKVVTSFNKNQPGDIFQDQFINYSNLQKFTKLGESFQVSLSHFSITQDDDQTKKHFDPLVVEKIILLLLNQDDLFEENFKIIECDYKNCLKISAIVQPNENFKSIIKLKSSNHLNRVLKYDFKDSNINRTDLGDGDLYLTPFHVNFKILENNPPAYSEISNSS